MIELHPRAARALEIAFWLLLAAAPLAFPDQRVLLTQILIAGLFAVSLDIALGHAGILTVGHALFFGAGAYAAGLLSSHGWGEPLSGLALSLAAGALLGWLSGFLVARAGDLARLMITIGLCLLGGELANRLSSVTGGADGLQGIDMWPVLGLFRFDMFGRTGFAYAFCVVLLAFGAVRLLLRSPFGLALRGIHANPRRMRALGSPVDARLRQAYAISAALAALAGALLAQTTQFVGLEMLGFNRSAEILIILVLGGAGRLYGGMVGALLYMIAHDVFADLDPRYWMFWLGLFLIAAVLLGRGGVLGGLARWVRVRERA
ncbi:branched-chain amino acid ABC transporter permease [Pigmentiphaga soli]|uniref:Branched-chain amino acid ABC transporter permease n=1 Tax=Pigmentiphaga soli TaxID=1007095 RepID=A0ABP8H1Z8_9BURK